MSPIGLDGRRAGPSIALPRDTDGVFADGTGYIIAAGSAGGYLVRPNAARRITLGTLIATGPTRWLVRDCNELPRCQPVVIDRATGIRHAVRDSPALGGGFGPVGPISPDGSVAALLAGGPDLADLGTWVHLIDLGTGADRRLDVPLGDTVHPQTLAWSPDSRWLFIIGNEGLLYAVDVATGRVTDFGLLVPPVNLIAMRAGTG
jgi:hypothetical protein